MIAVVIIQSRAISSLSPISDCLIGACATLFRWTEASEAAACTSQLQQLAAGGAGEGVRDHPLPGHLYERGPGPPTGSDRGQSAGNCHAERLLAGSKIANAALQPHMIRLWGANVSVHMYRLKWYKERKKNRITHFKRKNFSKNINILQSLKKGFL